MSLRLRFPAAAAGEVARRLSGMWAGRVCAEQADGLQEPIRIALRPGVKGSSDVDRVGHGAWLDWQEAWLATGPDEAIGRTLELEPIQVQSVRSDQPRWLVLMNLASALDFLALGGGPELDVDLARARQIAADLHASGAVVAPGALKLVCRLPDVDVAAALQVVAWLREHPELSGWTIRQLPIPQVHTKWLIAHNTLIRVLTGRDVVAETRERLSVVHLTYVDPDYLATGGRRHDAWTMGDTHDLAYRPRIVLVVENRDCRLWFPDLEGAVVVEGGGAAAATLLSRIDWMLEADVILYWGDIDVDGYAILHGLRTELRGHGFEVQSILMDLVTFARYEHLGVDHDRNGRRLVASKKRFGLTGPENDGYAQVATDGPARVRRIEQEKIALVDAAAAVRAAVLLAARQGSPAVATSALPVAQH